MWEIIHEKFKKYPARIRVAEKMIELGLSVHEDGKIYCGNLKISDKALATAANVDRRAIKSTIEVINEDSELFDLFNNIIPAGTLLKNIAKIVDLGVIEIEVGSDNEGVLAAATNLITNNGINIRQAYAEDSELQKYPILTVITNEPINGELINEFLKIKGVNRVSIYWFNPASILAFSISLSSSSRISNNSSQASKDSLATSSDNFSIA